MTAPRSDDEIRADVDAYATSAEQDPTREDTMKKIVNVTEVEGGGLAGLLGETIEVWSLNYIYSGVLVGIDDDCLQLDEARVVYETGPLTGAARDAQPLGGSVFVLRRCVEMVRVR